MDSTGNSRERKIIIKDYNLKELATVYCVGIKKMRKMLDQARNKIGWPLGRSYLVRQVEIIFNIYTPPYSVYMHDLNEDEFIKKTDARTEKANHPTIRPKKKTNTKKKTVRKKATSKKRPRKNVKRTKRK